jgi:hypothetical protein
MNPFGWTLTRMLLNHSMFERLFRASNIQRHLHRGPECLYDVLTAAQWHGRRILPVLFHFFRLTLSLLEPKADKWRSARAMQLCAALH